MAPPLNIWPDLIEADIGNSHTSGVPGWLIRLGGIIKTGSARVNHSWLIASATGILEAVGRIRAASLAAYLDTPSAIYRYRHWTFEERVAVVAQMESIIGQGYGWGKIVLHALDSFIPGQHYPFTRLFGVTSFKVCSSAIAWAAYNAGARWPFGPINWRSVTPDYLDDWVRSHPEDWLVVHDTVSKTKGQNV